MELTEVTFWENYWANCKLPSEVDFNLSFDRCLANALKKHLPRLTGDVFEVGCAPGKWLAFMAKEYGVNPYGLEYSAAGMQATLENFKMLGLDTGSIRVGDFFQRTPERQFDAVMSYGFIEHFKDVDDVVDLHLRWLKPGGILILGVPNFQGLYSLIQSTLDQEILDKHNLDIMNLDYFRHLSTRFSLESLYLDYIGSFEPSLPIAKHKYGSPLQFMVKSFLRIAGPCRNFKMFDSINHRYFSSYILAIYQKS
jgi:SAM-dependent methyltransferase